MAGGNVFAKERAILTLTSTGASMANIAGVACGTDLDCRTGGNLPEDFQGWFELMCQWASTPTNIAAGTVICDLYLVPKLDGTNLSQIVDLTSGSSYIPPTCREGAFLAAKAIAATTDTRFVCRAVDLGPLLYTPHLINRSGYTITANWTLKALGAQVQYT